jgi:hypothetical protein
MQCLVCPAKFDHTPAEASETDLAHAAGPAEKEALHVHARRKRAAEQSAWKFVQLTLDGVTVEQGHVCPAHANAASVTISKAVVK